MNKNNSFWVVLLVGLSHFACAGGDDDGIVSTGSESSPTTNPSSTVPANSMPVGSPSPTPGSPSAPTPAPAEPSGCSNADSSQLPIDSTGWVARECNDFAIQGAWYCYDDGINESGCTADTPPYVDGMGMCLTGNTTVDDTFMAWGAGIGLSLNDLGEEGGSVKSAYQAGANGLTHFHVEITGNTAGLPVRINFTGSPDTTGTISPFWEVPGAGIYDIAIADANVPTDWGVPESGDVADPNNLYDVQIQIVGGELAAAYSFCVTALYPVSM